MSTYVDGSRYRALRMTPEERFWGRVDFRGDCWEWKGSRHRLGYGRYDIDLDGQHHVYAHRIAYRLLVGFMPQEIDHLCRNKACVNPDHLEPVSHLENMRRVRIIRYHDNRHAEQREFAARRREQQRLEQAS